MPRPARYYEVREWGAMRYEGGRMQRQEREHRWMQVRKATEGGPTNEQESERRTVSNARAINEEALATLV